MSNIQKQSLGGVNELNFLRIFAARRVDILNTLGTHPKLQNLWVAFNVLWFPEDLIIHPLAIYCIKIVVLWLFEKKWRSSSALWLQGEVQFVT
jgi:hypothetical protein